MANYNVYQIRISDEIHNYVNSNGNGHLGAEKKYPIYEANMRLRHSFGDDINFKDTDFQHFTKVCEVKRTAPMSPVKIEHVEDVFVLLNGGYYNEDTGKDRVFDAHVSGYKTKERIVNGETITLRAMHSLSVGDIVEDVDNGTFQIVAGFGFEDVTQQVWDSIVVTISEGNKSPYQE
tara:strand:- start:253 stop:783 length:531 start_codon:yes stop_codon:yes gene_type:complete